LSGLPPSRLAKGTFTPMLSQNLINSAIQQLNAFHLCDGTLDSYQSRAFKPVSDYYCQKEELYYQPELTDELKMIYYEQFNLGIISRNTFCWRMRGIEILKEMRQHGCFKRKVFNVKKNLLPCYYEKILSGFIDIIGVIKRIAIYRSIAERYFIYLFTHSHNTLVAVSCSDIKNFMLEISASRPKSMDDVVTVLRWLHSYLRDEGLMHICPIPNLIDSINTLYIENQRG